MNRLNKTFLIPLLLIIISSCSIPDNTLYTTKEIKIAPGPEDIVIDSISSDSDRLIISCASRRKDVSRETNGIYSYDFAIDTVIEFDRYNEPLNLSFHPHGIDMAYINDQAFLYVINHEDSIEKQSILVYEIKSDSLFFHKSIEHELIISPNDIFVNNDGSFYYSNDANIRGNRWEIFLKKKKASVVYFSPDLNPIIVDSAIGYPNGVYFKDDFLYVSTVSENKLYRYLKQNDKFINKTCLSNEIPGGDNINPYNEGLLIPSHPNFLAFIRHMNNSEIESPSIIYHYSFDKNNPEVIFADDGSRISAASTALIYDHKLYISQVFDDFVLVVDLPE